jgi:hypothetical protein
VRPQVETTRFPRIAQGSDVSGRHGRRHGQRHHRVEPRPLTRVNLDDAAPEPGTGICCAGRCAAVSINVAIRLTTGTTITMTTGLSGRAQSRVASEIPKFDRCERCQVGHYEDMPSLTPAELQEARRRSRPARRSSPEADGRGGPPCRAGGVGAAGYQVSGRAHLGDGDPDAWRCALRVFEQAFGRPQEQATPTEDPALPTNAWEAQSLSWMQLQILAARVLELPTGEDEIATNERRAGHGAPTTARPRRRRPSPANGPSERGLKTQRTQGEASSSLARARTYAQDKTIPSSGSEAASERGLPREVATQVGPGRRPIGSLVRGIRAA